MARKPQDNPQLDMTPMIDVVFELIIFFVVTIKQEDIFSKLNANRPAPASSSAASEENDTQVKIDIGSGGLVFNGRMMNMKQFDQSMREISKTSKNSMVVIRCTLDSPHKYLVDALDTCNKYQMYNVSVFSI
ncbi:MAG: biopolymer transporter ExbD [Kiritimatiellae bacterium]|nr:biopolymer transporter ExbD [Kiritimatiellia bacterium]